MAKLTSIELAVHEGPISPSWTYLPVTPLTVQNNTRQQHRVKILGKDIGAQQLTILLKPQFFQCISGTRKTIKPPRPVLIGFDVSRQFKSAKLIFWKQLVFLQDSVLLGDSKSEILRDKDVIVINALCDFIFEKHDNDISKCDTSSNKADANNMIKYSSFWDVEEEINEHEIELLPEIKRKVDKLLQKLTSLEQLHIDEEKRYTSTHKKSKKRKASQGGSDTEISNNFSTESNQSEGNEKKQKKQSADELMTQDDKIVSDVNKSDTLFSRSKKKRKKKKKSESNMVILDDLDTSFTHSTYEVTKSNEIQSLNSREGDEVLDHSTTEASLPKNNIESTNHATEPIDVGLSIYNHTKNANQKSLFSKDNEIDEIQGSAAASIVVETSLPKKNSNICRTIKSRLGVSSLLLELRNQQANEIKCKENEPEINKRENGKPMEINKLESVTTSTQVEPAQAAPKRRRVRKKKNKKVKSDLNTSVENSECMNRDYSLRFPEHQMPQNTRVTFECDSEDDAEKGNQTVGTVQSTPLIQQYSPDNQTASDRKVTPNSDDQPKHSVNVMVSSDHDQVAFNAAGVAINPDGKFQALLQQYGRTGRQFETISSEGGLTVIRSSRQRRNKSTAKMADAVDPERDILTNVSIITQHNTPTPNTMQAISSAAGDSYKNLPAQNHQNRLSLSHMNATKQENNSMPFVEVTPLYMNYDSCQNLCDIPMEGDVIAYKILELSEDYTPGLSKFKEAKVINIDTQSGSLLLESRERNNRRRSGRFEMSVNDTENPSAEQDGNLVVVGLADLVDTRLVSRPVAQK